MRSVQQRRKPGEGASERPQEGLFRKKGLATLNATERSSKLGHTCVHRSYMDAGPHGGTCGSSKNPAIFGSVVGRQDVHPLCCLVRIVVRSFTCDSFGIKIFWLIVFSLVHQLSAFGDLHLNQDTAFIRAQSKASERQELRDLRPQRGEGVY